MTLNQSGNATVSLQASPDLVDQFDEWVADSEYANRSEALRQLMREAAEAPTLRGTPLVPPSDDQLATAYQRLCAVANDDGIVRSKTADSVLAAMLGVSATEVESLVLKPLQERRYIFQRSDVYGNHAWKINGWDPGPDAIDGDRDE